LRGDWWRFQHQTRPHTRRILCSNSLNANLTGLLPGDHDLHSSCARCHRHYHCPLGHQEDSKDPEHGVSKGRKNRHHFDGELDHLVVVMACLDYYRADHSCLKRINILEGPWRCERQNEGLPLRKTSRVEESRAIVDGCIACRIGKGEIWEWRNRLSGREYYEGTEINGGRQTTVSPT